MIGEDSIRSRSTERPLIDNRRDWPGLTAICRRMRAALDIRNADLAQPLLIHTHRLYNLTTEGHL